jgi:hypothetical protein
MRKSAKGFQDHRFLIICLSLLSLFARVVPALCVSLDTSGDAAYCEVKDIHVSKATVQDPNPEHVIYGLEGSYLYTSVGDMACPSGVHTTSGKGEWLKAAPGYRGTAIETFGPVKTMSKCVENPWINLSTDCIVLEKNLPKGLAYGGPVPISPAAMNGAQKQNLKQSQLAMVLAKNLAANAPTGPLIQILSPQGGQEYGGDIPLTVKIRSDVQAKVSKINLKWIWYKPANPGQWHGDAVVMNILPEISVQNGEAKTVIPRSKFEQYSGQWQVTCDGNLGQTPTAIFRVSFKIPIIHRENTIPFPQQKK